MSFYFVGDLHADNDIRKLSRSYFPEGKHLTEDDYIFVCGDFELVWYPEDFCVKKFVKNQRHWVSWLQTVFPKTKILVTLGNHENYDLINELPQIDMFGDKVRKLNDQIYIFERGRVYTIAGKKILSIGGALSVDKTWRLTNETKGTGKLWWEQELWTYKEEHDCLDLLDKYDWKVDYVVSHTAPANVLESMFSIHWDRYVRIEDPTAKYFQEIYNNLSFKHWWFGHFHEDKKWYDFTCAWYNIEKVEI